MERIKLSTISKTSSGVIAGPMCAEQVDKDVGDGEKMWNWDGPWGTVAGVWHPKGAPVILDSE